MSNYKRNFYKVFRIEFFMYNNYEDIKQTLVEVGCPESYIQKGLNELGFSSFPESGLSDKGKSKLLKKVLDIQKNDANLSLRTHKTKVVKNEGKIVIEKAKSLELEILREDLEKIGNGAKKYMPKVIRGALKTLVYPILVPFAFPTMWKKSFDYSNELDAAFPWVLTLFGGINETGILYTALDLTNNSKFILPIILAQLGTNALSGLYEWGRNIKKRAKKRKNYKT